MNESRSPSIWKLLGEPGWGYACAVIIALSLAAATRFLFTPYSYWLDELFSVTASSESLATLHRLIISDVHPPLYPIVLKMWITFFGNGETATRALSWICAVVALAIFADRGRRSGATFFISSTVFFATNALFLFYANETRSYALTLLLATIVVSTFPKSGETNPSAQFLINCLFLSLAHYFGLILAGVLLLGCLIQVRFDLRSFLKVGITGAVCLVWPAYHFLAGDLAARSGGNFWIQINGVRDTFQYAIYGFFPSVPESVFSLKSYFAIGAFVAVSLLAYFSYTRGKLRGDSLPKSLLFPCLAVLVFVSVVAAIDLWSPISTQRNYIVLLPLVSLMVGGACEVAAREFPKIRYAALLSVSVFGLLSINSAYQQIREKAAARQDWKGASVRLMEVSDGMNLYFTSGVDFEAFREWRGLIANFYLGKFSNGELRAKEYIIGKTQIQRPALIIFGHDLSNHEALLSEVERMNGRQVFEGYDPDLWGVPTSSAGVFLIE